jgi:pSer/pThr/pTyr-binding forkhead associated (FHA) protein
MHMMSTKTDPSFVEWTVDDEVIRLREWASERFHDLPLAALGDQAALGAWLLGSAEDCALRLRDPSQRISRHHAQLSRERSRWNLLDLNSKNGLRVDGTRQTNAVLDPGLEIGIGGLTLIAESMRLIELRSFLARLLGWNNDRAETIDLAMRAVRMAQARRTPLVLRGEGDLVPIAFDLHRRELGTERPFILCDPRRQSTEANVRSTTNLHRGVEALAAARGGSLCVRSNRPPADFLKVLAQLRDPDSQVQLIVCDPSPHDAESLLAVPITIPPLTARSHELAHIIHEYTFDAAVAFGVPLRIYTEDRAWIVEHSASSLHEIEKGTRRLMALRVAGSILGAADMLGMAAVSLRRWIGRRSVPSLGRGTLEHEATS